MRFYEYDLLLLAGLIQLEITSLIIATLSMDARYSAINMSYFSGTNNYLFDPWTLCMTAILDYDWAHVASVVCLGLV